MPYGEEIGAVILGWGGWFRASQALEWYNEPFPECANGTGASPFIEDHVSLRDDVERYIQSGHPRELESLLAACTRDGSLEALLCITRLFEDMYGGITFNYELKSPAAWELACWGNGVSIS